MYSAADKLAVLHPLRPRISQPLAAVFLVFPVGSFEPNHLRIPLEREDVGANAVEEVAVVGNDHGTPCKGLYALLECLRARSASVREKLLPEPSRCRNSSR